MQKAFSKILILIVLLVVIIGGVAISFLLPKKIAKENPNIGDIITNPKLYEGNIVILEGKFGGWGTWCDSVYGNKSAPVYLTRSDTLICDETGSLYMSFDMSGYQSVAPEVLYKEKELDPGDKENEGGDITIKGIIQLIDGKPIIIGDGQSNKKDKIADWQTYQNEEWGFEIRYPIVDTNYNVIESKQGDAVIIGIGTPQMPYYKIAITEWLFSLQELKSSWQSSFQELINATNRVDIKAHWREIAISGEDAIEISYEQFIGGYTGTTHRVGILKDGFVFDISLVHGSEKEFYQILSTFSFID